MGRVSCQFPAIADVVSRVDAKTAVLDGEIVALGADGRPSFQALHHSSFAGVSLVYYAFDLLYLNGRDLTRAPLDERRAALRDIVGDSGVLLSEPLPGTPEQIASAVRRLGLEGVVAKRSRSTYAAGRRSDAWIKVQFAKRFYPTPARRGVSRDSCARGEAMSVRQPAERHENPLGRGDQR